MLDTTASTCDMDDRTEVPYGLGCQPSQRYSAGPQWHCVRTLYANQRTADIEVRLAGFQVFNPSVWKPATRSRRDANGVVRPGKPDRIEALFPRYLFVRFDAAVDNWQQIRRLPGVEQLMMSASMRPIPVPAAEIVAIRNICAPNDCIYPQEHFAPSIPAGATVIAPAAGADITGICEWSDGKRVRFLMDIMGRTVRVTVDQAQVRVV